MSRDYYETLGVDHGASDRELKRAFRRLAKKLHPDCHDGCPEKAAAFKEVSEAYAVLSDPEKRSLYDQFGPAGLEGAVGAGPGGFTVDFDAVMGGFGANLGIDFEQMFGGRRRSGGRKGRDVSLSVQVGMLDALCGCEQTVNYRPDRGGEGKAVRVRIPAGSRSGDNLRVPGQGVAGRRGGAAGDLQIKLEVVPHPAVRWEGDAVVMDLPLTCLEAYRGARVEVYAPCGPLKVKIPAGSRTGQKLRLKGRGPKRKGSPVDLILRLAVQLPEGSDEGVLQALETVEKAYGDCVRSKLPPLS